MDGNYRAEGLFEVAQKVFLRRGGDMLVLVNPRFNVGDVPGGRLSPDDTLFDLRASLDRELFEELGPDVRIELEPEPLFVQPYTTNEGRLEVLGFWYTAVWQGGEIRLSEEHGSYSWMPPAEAVDLFDGHFQTALKHYISLGCPV